MVDDEKNEAAVGGKAAEIQADDSRIRVLVIPTNEELSIAQQVRRNWGCKTHHCSYMMNVQWFS